MWYVTFIDAFNLQVAYRLNPNGLMSNVGWFAGFIGCFSPMWRMIGKGKQQEIEKGRNNLASTTNNSVTRYQWGCQTVPIYRVIILYANLSLDAQCSEMQRDYPWDPKYEVTTRKLPIFSLLEKLDNYCLIKLCVWSCWYKHILNSNNLENFKQILHLER